MRPAFATLLFLALVYGAARADDPPPKLGPAQVEGRRLFLQSVAWVTAGRKDLDRIRTMHVDVRDLDMGRHEGHLRVWYEAPDKFRWSLRQAEGRRPQIKVLNGEQMWNSPEPRRGAPRRWLSHRKMGPEGMAAIAQLKEDRDQFVRLTRFVSLGSFLGAGVTFESLGTAAWSAGHLKGRWMKVRRRAPDGERLSFLFATEKAADGSVRATWPAAVLQAPDPARGRPAEHVVLRHWQARAEGARPSRVERWVQGPDGFDKVMSGNLVELRVNGRLSAGRFQPKGER